MFFLHPNIHARKKRYQKYTRYQEKHYLSRLFNIFGLLIILMVTHSVAIHYIEGINFADAIWLTVTTVTTVGYGDVSATTTAGRIITFITLYVMGIALLAQLAAEFFDYRMLVKEQKKTGKWRWKMSNHIVIINTPETQTEAYLFNLVSQIRATPALEDLPIQILSKRFSEGLPETLVNLGVVHYQGGAEHTENLYAVNVDKASHIILIARDSEPAISDSITYDILTRINEIGTDSNIIAEVTDDHNRNRTKQAGANVVIRPVRAYPELLVRAMVAPGTEEVLENFFKHHDSHMVRIDVNFDTNNWATLVCKFVTAGLGIPLAYINTGNIYVNPLPNTPCGGSGIIVLVHESQTPTQSAAEQCLNA